MAGDVLAGQDQPLGSDTTEQIRQWGRMAQVGQRLDDFRDIGYRYFCVAMLIAVIMSTTRTVVSLMRW
jgi:hypothetical protein